MSHQPTRQSKGRRSAIAIALALFFSLTALTPAFATAEPAQDPSNLLEWIVEVVSGWFDGSRGTIDPNG